MLILQIAAGIAVYAAVSAVWTAMSSGDHFTDRAYEDRIRAHNARIKAMQPTVISRVRLFYKGLREMCAQL
jgi:hypothetical protein